MLPIHHKVFQLADNGYEHPLEMLSSAISRDEKSLWQIFSSDGRRKQFHPLSIS